VNRKEAEELLYKEEDRRNTIMHDLNFAVTLLGIQVGVMYFYITTYLTNISTAHCVSEYEVWLGNSFLLLIGASVVLMVLAVFFIVNVFAKNKYHYYPRSTEMLDFFKSMVCYHNGISERAKPDYDEAMMLRAIEATDKNQSINQYRKQYTQWAIRLLFYAFLALFLALILYFFLPKDLSSAVRIEAIEDTVYIEDAKPSVMDYLDEGRLI